MSIETPCIAVCMIDPDQPLFWLWTHLAEIARCMHRQCRAVGDHGIVASADGRGRIASLAPAATKTADIRSRKACRESLPARCSCAGSDGRRRVAYGTRADRARSTTVFGHAAPACGAAGACGADRTRADREFALRAQINGVNAPMVIDTGQIVVLTYEPQGRGAALELLDYERRQLPRYRYHRCVDAVDLRAQGEFAGRRVRSARTRRLRRTLAQHVRNGGACARDLLGVAIGHTAPAVAAAQEQRAGSDSRHAFENWMVSCFS